MANKKDVFNAFYEGVCCILMSSNVLGSVVAEALEIDIDEFRLFLDEHPEYERIRVSLDI